MIDFSRVSATIPRSPSGISSLQNKAYREVLRRIQTAEYPAGTFLSERQLADVLGMSKTPIRSALMMLQSEGLVTIAPQQGVVVRGLSLQEVRDLFDLRTAVESHVVRRLADQTSEDIVKRLTDNLRRQKGAARARDAGAAVGLDVEFHLTFAELSGNMEIVELMQRVLTKLYREIARVNKSAEDRLAASFREHEAIVLAVSEKNANLAASRMIEHLQFGRQFLLSS